METIRNQKNCAEYKAHWKQARQSPSHQHKDDVVQIEKLLGMVRESEGCRQERRERQRDRQQSEVPALE